MTGILNLLMGTVRSAAATDPYFEYTTLLLPGSGTNGAQNNTFLDGSTNNFTITRNGNTTQGTFSPFSQTGWGNYFNGSSRFNLASNVALTPGSGDFTIECWIYPTAAFSTYNGIFVGDATGAMNFGKISGGIGLRISGTSDIISATAPSINQWTHVAITRSGTDVRLFYNGEQQGSTVTNSTNFVQSATSIGDNGSGTAYWNGYISNLRFVKGTAVYTSNFTPSATPLTAISNTQLLTCQSNRFIDNSTNNFTITRNGDTSVVAFSPFNPTASWSAATNGGSGYFDGSGDYLTVPYTTALQFTGNFTIEFWAYPNSTQVSAAGMFGNYSSWPSSTGVSMFAGHSSVSTTKWVVALFGTFPAITSTNDYVKNAWSHIALVRNGTGSNNITLYVNGVASGTFTSNNTVTGTANNWWICATGDSPTTQNFNGNICDFRAVGSAVYTTAFTPPTAPLTAITNTSLLLNFTNAGVYDATSKNDLETVGNAQISTTQSKWGGSSISFDGTGDWLLIPDQPPQRIGTGNFTVEMWVYRNSSGTYGLAGKGTGTTGWLVSLNSSNQVVFTYGSSTITSSGTVSATTWTHIAVVREGTSTNQTKIYISGANDGTGTVSTDFNQTNSMYIGADRTGGSAANAYVQDVRITNYARYTANFTPPTAAFPTL